MIRSSAKALEVARKVMNCDDANLNEVVAGRDGICYPPCRTHAAIASALLAWGDAEYGRGFNNGLETGVSATAQGIPLKQFRCEKP